MNTDQLKGKWHQLKGEAKVQWGKLTDEIRPGRGPDGEARPAAAGTMRIARERAEREVRASKIATPVTRYRHQTNRSPSEPIQFTMFGW